MSSQPFKKILVIDDDPVHVKLLEGVLKKEGYEVTIQTDAARGLQTAMDQNPDLILLDVMMPIINGYNLCKLLKSQENKKHISVILVTSRDQRDDVDIGMEVGADAYLTKPVNTAELFKTIKVVESMKSGGNKKP